MKIKPLADRILVSRSTAEEKTPGGLFIPDTAKDKPSQGVVLAVGEGTYLPDGTLRPLEVAVGDRILFGKYDGHEVEIDGEKLLVMREENVLGVIEGSATPALSMVAGGESEEGEPEEGEPEDETDDDEDTQPQPKPAEEELDEELDEDVEAERNVEEEPVEPKPQSASL